MDGFVTIDPGEAAGLLGYASEAEMNSDVDLAVLLCDLEDLAEDLGAVTNDLGYHVFPTAGDCDAFLDLLREEGVSVRLVERVDNIIAHLPG